MKLSNIFILMSIFSNSLFAQYDFTWAKLADLPIRCTNNAVVSAFDIDGVCIYSFGGMDSTKNYTGIHKRSFKLSLKTNVWEELAQLPDTLGKIASAASVIRNKIYILGGYHVLAGGNEISSNKVHIFDPLTEQFLNDGIAIPVAIDDHVQAIWRDSLLFVITGWSNSQNVPMVQIYNPFLNIWLSGTPTPNNNSFKAFGASGTIVGDTIYYYGGARSGSNFPATPYFRKGIISPNDPSQITWIQEADNPYGSRYRSASSNFNEHLFWFGGSSTSYNYDGIAYNGSGGVEPCADIMCYNYKLKSWSQLGNQAHAVMDLRGIAKIDSAKWVLVGGMDSAQNVSAYVHLIELKYNSNTLADSLQKFDVKLFPNPCYDEITVEFNIPSCISIIDIFGRELINLSQSAKHSIDTNNLDSGIYFLQVPSGKTWSFIKMD